MEDGPPIFSADSSCLQILLVRLRSSPFRLQDSHLLRLAFPCHSSTGLSRLCRPTPSLFLKPVWPPPLSLAATHGISFDFSSSPYLDVSVREVPLSALYIQTEMYDSSSYGFPHSDICGSMLISNSPQLFAGYHVLLRLSVPRHSPYALFRLNSFLANSLISFLCFLCLSFANSSGCKSP